VSEAAGAAHAELRGLRLPFLSAALGEFFQLYPADQP